MKIDASGNVGIGTSSPAKLLDVSSDSSPTVRISNTRNDTGWDVDPVFGALEFYSADTSGSGASVRASLTAEAASSFGNATNFIFRNGDSLGVQQENMRLDYRGYLGIGVTNPYTTFHVNSDTLNEVARFESGDATAYISLQDNTTSNDLHGIGATGDVLQLFSNNSEAMRIDSSGNVGIGTSFPTVTTEISSASIHDQLRVHRDVSGDNTTAGAIQFAGNDSGGNVTDYARIKGLAKSDNAGSEDGHLVFETMLNASISEAMRIDENGNVGIGTSSPASDLHVSHGFGKKYRLQVELRINFVTTADTKCML